MHVSFVSLALHPTPHTKISGRYAWRFKKLYFDNHSKLDTCSHELFYVTITTTITLKNTGLFSLITLPVHAVILMPEPPNIANSCSQHGPDIVLLTLEWPGNITHVPETFIVFRGHCLYWCDGGSLYLPARTVDNARKAAHRQLRI